MVATTSVDTTMAAIIIIFFIIACKGTTIVINEQTICGFFNAMQIRLVMDM